MGKSAYAVKQRETIDAYMHIAERITRQFDVDTMNIALHRYGKVNLGYQRIMEITELWMEVRREFEKAITKNPESDVYQHHLDQALKEIAKDEKRVTPFHERYPEMRRERYEGKRRG